MFTQIRWRIAAGYVALVTLFMSGLALYVAQPACRADSGCVWTAVLIATVILAVGTFGLAFIIAERTARPLRELTAVIQRTAKGDLNARTLPTNRDEVGQLVVAYNNMIDQVSQRLNLLAEERQQLSTVLATMADGVLIVDERNRVQLLNPTAARLLGTGEKRTNDRSFAEVVRHHQLIELLHQCRDEGVEQTGAVELSPDLFLQVSVTPFQENGGRGYVVLLHDLTAVRRLETVRRDFVSNISHELRTPLASLRAVVETLQDGALEDPPAAQRFLRRAEEEVDALTHMVEELLELSRIESGQVPFKLQETAVADLILPPLERLQTQAERAELRLIADLPAHLPTVHADAERVRQVMTNLLYNAIKFTPPGGKITVQAVLQTAEVIISVQDTGVGITAGDVPRIFERFYKLDQARTRGRGGTGLGLAIARHIVQAHNGRIWVRSREGKGSTFYFSLPLAARD
jgi:two-component system phosphate regulon sensor histidine kinase PhoR